MNIPVESQVLKPILFRNLSGWNQPFSGTENNELVPKLTWINVKKYRNFQMNEKIVQD